MELESEPLASYNSKVLVTGCCLEIVKEGVSSASQNGLSLFPL